MKKKKFMCIVLLLILLILLLVYSHLEFNTHDYPNSGYIFENYQMFNNTEITFKAKIKEIYPTNQTITANIGDPPYSLVEIKTKNIDSQLQKGDNIFVIGILNGKKTITAERIFFKEPYNDYLIVLCSIPAIPFVLYLFFRTWRFNRKTVSFERRQNNV